MSGDNDTIRLLSPPRRSAFKVRALLWRKERLLRCRRPLATLCELLVPLALCSLGSLGAAFSQVVEYPERHFAPGNLSAARATALPPAVLQGFLSAKTAGLPILGGAAAALPAGVPGAVPDLSLWLACAHFASSLPGLGQRAKVAPYDGSRLAVAPDDRETKALIQQMLLRARQFEALAASAARLNDSSLRKYLDGAESFFGGSGGGLAKLLPGGAGSAHGLLQAVLQFRLPEVRYYADERALLGAARQQGRVWAAVVLERPPPPEGEPGRYSYVLRLNRSAAPMTSSLLDRFAAGGFSRRFERYYSSGFLSLQTALDSAILRRVASTR